jgi:FkbM family methyltransferase
MDLGKECGMFIEKNSASQLSGLQDICIPHASIRFPSRVIKRKIGTAEGQIEIWIPENESFRVSNIFERHEYAIPPQFMPSSDVVILDVGANVGLFAIYMRIIKNNSTIHCFEPAPHTFNLLQRNLYNMKDVFTYPIGLGGQDMMAPLMLHPHNAGENSIKIHPETVAGSIEVQIRNATAVLDRIGLAYTDILKIDTEGCEIDILQNLKDRLGYVGIILLEYHCEADRRMIDLLLHDFTLFGANTINMNAGILKYINNRLI